MMEHLQLFLETLETLETLKNLYGSEGFILTGSFSDYLLGYVDDYRDVDVIVKKPGLLEYTLKYSRYDLKEVERYFDFPFDVFLLPDFEDYYIVGGIRHATLEHKIRVLKKGMLYCDDEKRDKIRGRLEIYNRKLTELSERGNKSPS